jgi:hypothetical protein
MTVDEVIDGIVRDAVSKLRGCTLSPRQYDRLLSLLDEHIGYAVHGATLRSNDTLHEEDFERDVWQHGKADAKG